MARFAARFLRGIETLQCNMFIVASYDIPDDRRRAQLASELENFGQRVQFSVFECHLTSIQFEEMRRRTARLIDPVEDRVRFYQLCEKDRRQILVDGPGDVTRDWDYYMV
jgi:CRISPR-associated protein Cas2